MLELNINSKSPAAITGALKKIKEMISSGSITKSTPIHIVLEPGHYTESIKYNLSNPITIESVPGTKPENCIISSNNCEAFNPGLSNRGVFVIGANATKVNLKNFSIKNEHEKNGENTISPEDSAEALVWANATGSLVCSGMIFSGRQNVLTLKGNTCFINSKVYGDVNIISGDVDIALFENCSIKVREDNRGDFEAYVVNSQALSKGKGFIFADCVFDGESRKKSMIYVCRTDGKGFAESEKNWDNIALLNCKISENFSPELVWDSDMDLEVFPRGNVKSGIREYNTKTFNEKDPTPVEVDTSRRNIKCYTLTDDDYFKNYASRYLILQDTALEVTN